MKILIITQYYLPEVGAPQNRLHSLSKNLQKLGHDVNILTAMPNYPEMKIHDSYKGKFWYTEEIDGISILRSWLFISKSDSKISRLLCYLSFSFTASVVGLFKGKRKYDLIISESPSLFIIIPALFLKIVKRATLNFNVSDVWPEIGIVFGHLKGKATIKFFYALERFCYYCSNTITGQTQGIVDSISTRFPSKKIHLLPNGYDFKELDEKTIEPFNLREKLELTADNVIFAYGGLLGHGYEVELMIKAAKAFEGSNASFVIIGDGTRRKELEQISHELNCRNVFFLGKVTLDIMQSILSEIDVLVIPVFKTTMDGIIPSKIFDALASGKPLLLGVDGEAKRKFIEKGKCGLFFNPGNLEELTSSINILLKDESLRKTLGQNGYSLGRKYFDRAEIAKDFMKFIEFVETPS